MSTIELPALYVDSVALVAATPRLVLVNRDPSPGEGGVPIGATLGLALREPGPGGRARVDRRRPRVRRQRRARARPGLRGPAGQRHADRRHAARRAASGGS